MAKRDKISEEDRSLFQQMVADVSPLKQERIAPQRERPAPHPRQRELDDRAVMAEMASGPTAPEDWVSGEALLHCPPGMTQKEWRKLRRGQFSVGAVLDLHGFTAEQARSALVAFIGDAQRRQIRCVRIIHGKGNSSPNGRPVLKSRIARWLHRLGAVWAFCSARPVDGGTGALYVLLRKGQS